jgi:hypothetical protein
MSTKKDNHDEGYAEPQVEIPNFMLNWSDEQKSGSY